MREKKTEKTYYIFTAKLPIFYDTKSKTESK